MIEKITIPLNLQVAAFRFIKLKRRSKVAVEKSWNTTCNYVFSDVEFVKYIEAGNNFGVVGGFGDLVIIDCDNSQITMAVEQALPETFTVKSSKGKHFYFICRDLKDPIRLYDQDGKNVGDVQSTGKYVVGPNCIHPSGSSYEVVNDVGIVEIPVEQLRVALTEWIILPKPARHEQQISKYGLTDYDLPIEKVIDTSGLFEKHGGFLQGPHPIHGSDSGINFKVTPELGLWHCFRHNSGGNVFTWIAVKHNIIKCHEALKGCLRGEKFLRVLQIAKEKYGLKISEKQIPLFLEDRELKEQVLISLAQGSAGKKIASELIVNRLLHDESLFTIRSDEKPEMWIYHEGIYVPNAMTKIYEFVGRMTAEAYTQPFANLVADKIRVRTYITAEDFFDKGNPYFIPVKNGLLNIKTKELQPFSPAIRFFSKIPVVFDKDAQCPAIQKHFATVLKNIEDVPVLEELFGFLLLKEYVYEKAFMFIGAGRNGKGKTIELMKRFLGQENVSSIPVQQFETDVYAPGNLHNKLANLAGDIGRKSLESTGFFKTLTGRDLISANRKYKTRLSFTNYAKLVFAANELPITYDTSTAFFERWILLEFPYMFVTQEVFDEATAVEKEMLKIKNPKIIDELSSEKELSGLLNLALAGFERLLKNGDFSYSKSRKQVEELWLRKSSSLLGFLMDCIEETDCGSISKKRFRVLYSEYCKKHKLRQVSDKIIKNVLPTHYAVSEERPTREDGKQISVWDGIKEKEIPLTQEQMMELYEIAKKNGGDKG